MKTYQDFIEKYVYEIPSDIVYRSNTDAEWFEDMIEERDESYRKYNLMSMVLSWIFEGRYEARSCLSRSKYRRLCKVVRMRHNSLKRKCK